MAFTEMEIQEAHAAAVARAGSEDLYKLGLIYATGQGGPIDYVQAHMWFNLAAMKGSKEAKESRKELSSLMSPCEISTAQKAAREWMAEKGVSNAAAPAPIVSEVRVASRLVSQGTMGRRH
jgi:uncharacterized protein